MKRIFLGYSILLLLAVTSIGVSAQVTGETKNFQVSDEHVLSAFARASLVWQEDESQVVSVNATMTDYRTNQSEITIAVLQIVFIDSSSGSQELAKTNSSEVVLTIDDPSVLFTEIISPPSGTDRFYLNINLFAYPEGASNASRYTFRFPSDNTIIVERENLVPVVNLYGFPSGSFFSFWLPIYGITIFMLAIPAILVGFQYLINRRNEDEIEEDSEEKLDETTESEPEVEIESVQTGKIDQEEQNNE